jgi:hypothetical protein
MSSEICSAGSRLQPGTRQPRPVRAWLWCRTSDPEHYFFALPLKPRFAALFPNSVVISIAVPFQLFVFAARLPYALLRQLTRSPVQVGIRLSPGAVHLGIDLHVAVWSAATAQSPGYRRRQNAGDYNACVLPICSSFNLFPDLSTAVPYLIGKSFVPVTESCRRFLPALPQRFINLPAYP